MSTKGNTRTICEIFSNAKRKIPELGPLKGHTYLSKSATTLIQAAGLFKYVRPFSRRRYDVFLVTFEKISKLFWLFDC